MCEKGREGDMDGFAGLMGSGRTELALSLFGNPKHYRTHGDVLVNGRPMRFTHPHSAISAGVAYATEGRKPAGLILIQDAKQNITLANLWSIADRGAVDVTPEVKVATGYRRTLH